MYKAGHYQSIFPITDNWTLRDIKRLGGFDVTTFLNLSEGEFVLYSFIKVFFILSLMYHSFHINTVLTEFTKI